MDTLGALTLATDHLMDQSPVGR
ncbi:hypothetical protein L195_g064328, partial [Trifolium pratense]